MWSSNHTDKQWAYAFRCDYNKPNPFILTYQRFTIGVLYTNIVKPEFPPRSVIQLFGC